MTELLIKQTKNCDCTEDEDCEVHGWDIRFCCGDMHEYFAQAGEGNLFCVDADGREATGLLIDPTLEGEALSAVACPSCGASVRVVEELSEGGNVQ